jgi:hypothetical protein
MGLNFSCLNLVILCQSRFCELLKVVQPTLRGLVYGVNNSRSYSQSDEVEMLGSWVHDLFPSYPSTPEEKLLLEEISHLVAYCCSLLALSPQKVAFQYDSTEAEQ